MELLEAQKGPERLNKRLEVPPDGLVLVGAVRGVVEAGEEHHIREDQDAAAVIIALRFDVGVRHQEHRQDDGDDIPAGEDQAVIKVNTGTLFAEEAGTHVKVSATEPIFSGAYQAENATIAGIWSRQTWSAYAEPISMLKRMNINNTS